MAVPGVRLVKSHDMLPSAFADFLLLLHAGSVIYAVESTARAETRGFAFASWKEPFSIRASRKS